MVAEAMSCCSNVYENPYIVEEGVNGILFNPEDPADIARAIRQMTSLSIEEREQMGDVTASSWLVRNTEKAFLHAYEQLIKNLK